MQFCSEYSVVAFTAAVSVIGGFFSYHFLAKSTVKKTKETPVEEPKKVTIHIGEYEYDITQFKHPGGNVIHFMTKGQDATNAFEEFHYRSKKARRILDSLPKTKITPLPIPSKEDSPQKGGGQGGTEFPLFRQSLEERGFFKPSYSHVAYRIVELCGIYSAAMYMIPINIYVSILLFGFFGGKCGWLQHEGGHNSLTGIIPIDKQIQNACIGFGLFTDGNMWNHMHNRHHATPQKIGHDMDLDTAPLVAFHKDVIAGKYGGNWIVQWWLRFQMVTFLPITSGVFVMFFWVLYLHPRKIIRDRNISQACIVLVGHTSRIFSFMILGKMDVYHALLCHVGSLWVSGVFLFGHFSLSHTFTPIVKEDENPDWARYAIEHTVDIAPDNPIVCWLMGYLNCQVIHHLFPSMPQFRGPEVSRELKTLCKKWGIEYRIVSYGEAWSYMFSNLYEVGGGAALPLTPSQLG